MIKLARSLSPFARFRVLFPILFHELFLGIRILSRLAVEHAHPAKRTGFIFLFFLTNLCIEGWSEERQVHGLEFEQKVWNHLFEQDYTADWDIPGEANLRNPGIPISVKYTQWGSSIYLGDAVRQRSIDQPFEMVIGFHESENDVRETVAIHHLSFTPQQWDAFWGDVTLDELEAFSEKIKEGTVAEAQDYARERAAELRESSPIISINPKINEDQRRIQCSIPFTVFYQDVLGMKPQRQDRLELWGRDW